MMILFGSSLAKGELWPVILPIAWVAAIFVVVRLQVSERRLRRFLQADTAGPLVDFYKRTIRPRLIPQGDALLAAASAMTYALYADYPSAHTALKEVAWENRPPLIRASRTSAEALLCYLESREYIQGLNLAMAAQELGAIHRWFPGAGRGAAVSESYVEIGHVLCGRSTDATVTSLERKMSALPLLSRLLVAWALAIAHRQHGDAARVGEMLAYIHEHAPHCRALELPDNSAHGQPLVAPKPRD